MNDLSLARAVRLPDVSDATERLGVLFDAHYDRLYRLARRLASSADDAQDLVQETFLKAARFPRAIPVGARRDEEAWLVRVMINTRRDQWRKISTRKRHDLSAFSASRWEPDERGVEASLIARNTVWQALDTLVPRRRAIVVMHELEGLAIPAIASLLGISAMTVRWHLSMGKRELTHTLKPCKGEKR
jgi:RNA polymerase sigma factor (sigma-70 family)